MKRFYSYIVLLSALVMTGCSTDSDGSFIDMSNATVTDTAPVAADVIRFFNGGAGLSNIPNTGAYVVAFAAPTIKQESSGAPFNVFSGTVSSTPSSQAAVYAFETVEETQEDEEFHTRLFPPFDRLKRLNDALAEGTAPEMFLTMTTSGRNVFALGDVWSGINATNWGTGQSIYINAKCVGITASAYFMSDIASPELPPAFLQEYMEKFESSYAKIRDSFALESDVDGNGKVIILFYDMKSSSILGYFDPVDKLSSPSSNRADMFYVNMTAASNPKDKDLVNFTLAHEFQHMVFFDNKYSYHAEYNASTWLDEGLAMLAGYLCGYYNDGNDSYVKGFISRYSTLSLTNWTSANYGYGMLFTVYLHERFGQDAIKSIYKSSYTGWKAVENAVGMDFNLLFGDFAVALAISGRGYTDEAKYNFKGIDFTKYLPNAKVNLMPAAAAVPVGQAYGVKVYPYGMSLREVSGRTSSLFLSGTPGGFVIVKK